MDRRNLYLNLWKWKNEFIGIFSLRVPAVTNLIYSHSQALLTLKDNPHSIKGKLCRDEKEITEYQE